MIFILNASFLLDQEPRGSPDQACLLRTTAVVIYMQILSLLPGKCSDPKPGSFSLPETGEQRCHPKSREGPPPQPGRSALSPRPGLRPRPARCLRLASIQELVRDGVIMVPIFPLDGAPITIRPPPSGRPREREKLPTHWPHSGLVSVLGWGLTPVSPANRIFSCNYHTLGLALTKLSPSNQVGVLGSDKLRLL